MPQAGFEPGSSTAILHEFERRLKPLGYHGQYLQSNIVFNILPNYLTKYNTRYAINVYVLLSD